jgi:hypothetical protein
MCEWLTPKERLECSGGECCPFRQPDEKAYFDKPDHFERSVAHQPQHLKHDKTIYGGIILKH